MNSPFILKFNAIKRFLMTEQEKETSWTLFNFPNIWARQRVQIYLRNYICYSRNSISPWTGPQTKTIFWSFFPRMVHTMTTKKISLVWAPVQAFLYICHFFWPFSLCQPWLKIILQRIWVIIFTKRSKLSVLELPSVRNNSLLLDTFCTFKNPIEPLNL